MFAPIFLERSISNPIPHCTKNVPEWINTLIEVNDFPARFWGKLKAKAGCVKDKTIEEVCMRCSGTSYKDIHYRKHDRFDRKFANDPVAPNAFVDRSDKDAVFLHFGQAKKNNIENVVKDMYGEIYASI